MEKLPSPLPYNPNLLNIYNFYELSAGKPHRRSFSGTFSLAGMDIIASDAQNQQLMNSASLVKHTTSATGSDGEGLGLGLSLGLDNGATTLDDMFGSGCLNIGDFTSSHGMKTVNHHQGLFDESQSVWGYGGADFVKSGLECCGVEFQSLHDCKCLFTVLLLLPLLLVNIN